MTTKREVGRLDANETAFFARQLEYVKAQTYDVQYPQLRATALIPVSTEAGPGAETITYRGYDSVGVCKLIASYADDLPRADVYASESTRAIKSFGTSYAYSIMDIRHAAMAGVPLEQRRATAARTAWEQLVNRVAFLADGTATYGGLYGLLYHPNIPCGPTASGVAWDDSVPADDIITDVNELLNGIRTLTKGVERPDTLLMPIRQYSLIASRPRSSVSDTTILEFLQRVHPGVAFEAVPDLASVKGPASGNTVDCLVAYQRSPDKLTLEIPQPFEQFDAQQQNLAYKVPCHGRIAGVIVYYPLSVAIAEMPVLA